jgi:hypothetical protein
MAYKSGQVSVGTSATALFTTGPDPAFSVVIYSSAACFVGPSGATTTTGLPIPATTPVTIPSSGALEDELFARLRCRTCRSPRKLPACALGFLGRLPQGSAGGEAAAPMIRCRVGRRSVPSLRAAGQPHHLVRV